MAVTETPPETVDAAAAEAASADRPHPTGLAGVLGTGDHKVIGRLYIVCSLIFGLLVLTLGELFAVESTKPATLDVFSSDTAYQLFSLARVGSVFLLGLPLVIGVAMVVVPLQVGARTIAFPRAAAASFWGWLLGSALMLGAYAANGGPGGGSAKGVDLWIAAMGLIVLSILLAAVSLATTVLALRAQGLTLPRTPMFAWSVAVAAIMWLLTLPVLFGQLVLMYVDHRSAGGVLVGGSASLLPGSAWVLRNPQVYVLAIPVLGFVADVIITMGHGRSRNRGLIQAAIGVFGVVSFGAFLVSPSKAGLESAIVVIMALVAVVPVLAVGALAGDGARRGSFKLNASVLYAVGALLVLLVATLGGAVGAIPGVLDAPQGGTVADNILSLGVSHAVVLAAVMAALGGIQFWATKVGRQAADEKAGALAPLLLLVGAVVATVPDMISGVTGSGNELFADFTGGVKGLNVVTTIGFAIVAVGLVVALVGLLPMLKRPDDDVPADPWEGQSLEWLAASPPPLGNFSDDLAPVTSAEPLIDLREEK